MLSILIVDDETLVRVGLKSLTDWEAHGFAIVGEADNGEQGYQMAKQYLPDIVLLDIRMPQMDGIELIRLLREEELCEGIIVLSSYSDFNYVKTAMKNGADDYILKVDLEEESLLGTLDAMRDRLDSRRKKRMQAQDGAALSQENMSNLRKSYIQDLILGACDQETVPESFRQLGIVLDESNLRAVAVELKTSSFLDGGTITRHEERRLHITIFNLLAEILRSYSGVYATELGVFEYILLSGGGDNGGRGFFLELAAHIRGLTEKYVGADIVVGISGAHEGIDRIPDCVHQAQTAAEYALVSLSSTVVFYEDISFVDTPAAQPLQEAVFALDSAFAKMDIHQIAAAIDDVIDAVRAAPRVRPGLLQEHWHVIAYMHKKFLRGIYELGSIDKALYDRLTGRPRKPPENAHNFITSMAWLRRTSLMLVRPQRSSQSLIRDIKEYIGDHYNEGLQLEDIATRFSLSPNYLCSLYKKTTGQNFIEYITEVRIGHAKHLLQTTTIKVSEISRMVGYENIYYFSKVFKKVTSVTPAAFRGGARRKAE